MSTGTLQTEIIVGAKQIAAATGLPPRRIYALVDQGKLPILKIGASIGIRRSKLAEWIESLETLTADAA